MLNNLLIFITALILVIKGATMATKHAGRLAESFNLSKYTIGFIIVAIIGILPEAFIALSASLKGAPAFGLGIIFGSNIADLTLIFAVIVFFAGRSLKIESKILKNHVAYPLILLLPIILGLNGYYSRLEGLALIVAGGVFYYLTLRNGSVTLKTRSNDGPRLKSFLMFLFSMIIMLIGSHLTINSATELAGYLGVSPILIGMLVVGLGTTMPELFFSLKSVKKHSDDLAIGDILGTVLADATIVVGLLAFVSPFSFPPRIVYFTGVFMVASSFILFRLMRSGRSLTKKEAFGLFLFWLAFAFVEFISSSWG